MFTGSIPALATPFTGGADGCDAIDETAYRDFIDWQIGEGSAALVPCGTTGEAPTLTTEEQHEAVRVCVEHAAGRVPVIAGCGSNDTRSVLRHLEHAERVGADAGLVVLPYYNRPSQMGLIAHFTWLAERSSLPIVVYNVPPRTSSDILPETLAEVAKLANVVAIKDASGIIERVSAHRDLIGQDFCQLSGNDAQTLALMVAGGHGCISVTANVVPRLCADFQHACAAGEWDKARALHDRLFPLHCALFADASPGPTKYALSRVRPGFPTACRLPILECSAEARKAVDAALDHAGLC